MRQEASCEPSRAATADTTSSWRLNAWQRKDARESIFEEKELPKKTAVSVEDRRKRARLKEVEALIDQLEDNLAALGHRLENPPADAAKVQKLGTEYVRVQRELEALMDEWGELHG